MLHLVHVIPRLQMPASFGAPPVDFLPQQDPVAYDQLVKHAEGFIAGRLLPSLASLRPQPIVHIIKASMQTACWLLLRAQSLILLLVLYYPCALHQVSVTCCTFTVLVTRMVTKYFVCDAVGGRHAEHRCCAVQKGGRHQVLQL